MRVAVVLCMIVACRDPVPPNVLEGDPANTVPVSSKAVVSTAVAAKTRPLGPLAPEPPPPTPANLQKRSCAIAGPVELGSSDRANVAVAFGSKSGIAAWSPSSTRLAIRAIDRAGNPRGVAHELDVPARVSSTYGIRALADHYLVFLADTDFTESSPIMKLYVVVADADGNASPGILQVAIGDRHMIDDVSPGAAHGALVWAGPTPATHIDNGRLVSIVIDDKGVLAQSFVDFPDPAPGTRAFAFFSFGDHAVTVIGRKQVIVDGELKSQKRNVETDGLLVAPTFTGTTVPIIGLSLGKDAKTMRYGTLGLDGTMTFDKEVPRAAPLRAPFEERVSWVVSTGDGTTSVSVIHPAGTAHGTSITVPPEIASGVMTKVVWSGEQILVLSGDGRTIRVAPLPCR